MSRPLIFVAATAAVLAAAAGGFFAGRQSADPHAAPAAAAPAAAASGERRVLYWHDPMVPGHRFDKPGKSPFMDMQLQPVYADEAAAAEAGVRISPQVQQNLGIRTAPVQKLDIAGTVDAVGTVQFDERLAVAVQTRSAGYVERLHVRAPMERVARGQPLATVFAPDWLGPLNELVALQRAGAAPELVAAAKERLHALSIPAELLREAEAGAVPQARYTLRAPAAGVVAELGVREGVAVSPGMTLFRIAGLERVWAVAELPEAQAVALARGQRVAAALQADPARRFDGTLQEILPQVNPATRTLQARFGVDNRGGHLVPGMLLRLQVAGPARQRLVVPAEAVLRTGTRAVVIVRQAGGGFEPREVALGADLGDRLEVLQGLAEGDEVVASGQFLVDSEARLRSVLGSLAVAPAAASAASAAGPAVHASQGRVESVEADSITISHEPVPSLKWPAMTMGFGKASPGAFADVKPGDTVRFEFRPGGPLDWELTAVQRTGGAR